MTNLPLTLLTSAARTANTSTATQTNPSNRGVILILNVTAASGTGGLQPQIRFLDLVGGSKIVWGIPLAVTATGTYVYVHYPGANTAQSASVHYAVSMPLSQFWSVTVTHKDSSSYTYSLTAYLLV